METESIKRQLMSALTNKRYIHTLGVAEESVKLAAKHGCDTKKAEIAGLLHDCAKDMPDKLKLNLSREFHIPLDKIMLEQPDLTHSFLGAEIARREYGVTDKDVLNAIRYHTTGRAHMCALEKIVYLADYFEPNRKPFKSMEKIKRLSYENLDKAMIFSLNESIKYINKKGRKIHKLTMEALSCYESKEEKIGD